MKSFLATLLALSMVLPAFAQGHVVPKLGVAPVFSPSSSFAEFVTKMHGDRARERAALAALGIDYAEFEHAIKSRVEYVKIPSHLDAMTYYEDGVKTVRDVTIPNTYYGWKLNVPGHVVYIPAICGNIAANKEGLISQAPRATSAPAPTPADEDSPKPTLQPSASPTPTSTQAPAPAVAVHRGKFPWWVLLVPVVLIHGGSNGNSLSAGPALNSSAGPLPTQHPLTSPAPAPPPLPSPSPSPSHTPCGTASTPAPSPTPKR